MCLFVVTNRQWSAFGNVESCNSQDGGFVVIFNILIIIPMFMIIFNINVLIINDKFITPIFMKIFNFNVLIIVSIFIGCLL